MRDDAQKVMDLCAQIGPILHGQGPIIQGAVLAELLAMWLAGHPEGLRGPLLEVHLTMVQPLVTLNAQRLWKDGKPRNA